MSHRWASGTQRIYGWASLDIVLAIKIDACPSWDPGPWLLSLYSVRCARVTLARVPIQLQLVKVKVTLWLTVSQSLSLGVELHLGLMTRYLLLFDTYGLVFVGRPLWREDGSVFCICCWPSPGSVSQVRVPWDLWPYFTLSVLRLPFHRLLRLAGSWWRYLALPPHGYYLTPTSAEVKKTWISTSTPSYAFMA
jgi:hypothetical protein